jgi:hypothetical protein
MYICAGGADDLGDWPLRDADVAIAAIGKSDARGVRRSRDLAADRAS